jgi:CRISPR-associated protein Csm2
MDIVDTYFKECKHLLLEMHTEPKELKQIVESVKKFAEKKYKGITSSQLRNLYNLALIQKKKSPQSFQLLRPKLAYINARQSNSDAKDIVDLLDSLIQKINDESDVIGFITFFEALVAYHKYYAK